MSSSPQYEKMQQDAKVNESSQSIYDAAQLCLKHFEHQLEAKVNSQEDNYLEIEELWRQFNQWATYLGVFVVPRASLDARLAPQKKIKNMMLELLDMIQDNLIYDSPNNAEEISESSLGLPAVKAAIDRLLILSVDLRCSALQTHRLKQKSHTERDESLCLLLVQTRFPSARKSLCSQPGASIYARGISLQYIQEHYKTFAYRKNGEDNFMTIVDEEERENHANAPVRSPNKDTVPTKLKKVARGADTLPTLVSLSAIVHINGRKTKPSSIVVSRGSAVQDGQLNEIDYPPLPRQKDGERHQSCAICAMPLDTKTLTKTTWHTHIDQDIEPYVCISEDCIEPLQYFSSLKSWMDHMLKRHSLNWSGQIHTERRYCDLNHNEDSLEFDTKAEFLNHLNTCHGATRDDPFACPLCDSVPSDIEKRRVEKPYELLWKHIAQHLKSLALLSLSYVAEDLEGRESIADISESLSNRNVTSLSLHSISGQSQSHSIEHLYCDRESCDCADQKKNSTPDW